MKCNFIHINLKNKNNFSKNKITELFKLSIENKIIDLCYNKNRKESSNKNLEIIYYKKFHKKNIGKMYYILISYALIKIVNKIFILNNIKRARFIINNKADKLKQHILSQKAFFKIKIKFLDIIINLNSMFKNCESLFSVNNFQNLNTKYLRKIYGLFAGCNSLSFIDGISNWRIDNINY